MKAWALGYSAIFTIFYTKNASEPTDKPTGTTNKVRRANEAGKNTDRSINKGKKRHVSEGGWTVDMGEEAMAEGDI